MTLKFIANKQTKNQNKQEKNIVFVFQTKPIARLHFSDNSRQRRSIELETNHCGNY